MKNVPIYTKIIKLFFLFYIGIKKERFLNLSCNYLERTLISPYISDKNATEPRDTIPAICSAPISLYVSATTVAIGAVSFLRCLMHFAINSTILSNMDLCVVQCCCLVDLFFDDCKCVHLIDS